MPPDSVELEQLGAQYREASDAIVVHRIRQAEAETALGHLLRSHRGPDTNEIIEAREHADQAYRDVLWCIACKIAAGEAYKGMTLDEAIAAGLTDRRNVAVPVLSFGGL
jgi:hypothetical protein